MSTDERAMPRESRWRGPREPEWFQSMQERAMALAQPRPLGLPDAVRGNEALRHAVIECPEDDAPRHAYAAWMAAQDHELAQLLGGFITAQLRVAQAFRASRRVDVRPLRSWRGDTAYVSTAEFRAGDMLRPWLLDDLSVLRARRLVAWPQIYRGFVERVSVRASDFLQIARDLFRLAPIRHLILVGVAEVVEELAACPHLMRIRSLSLPRHAAQDELGDDTLRRLIASPYLGQLSHLRLVQQHRVTPRAYEAVVTAPTLPQLSSVEVFTPRAGWEHMDPTSYAAWGRSERVINYDTVTPARRSKGWIGGLERALGYMPCLHPEDHYGRDVVDLEAVVENPIARDMRVMARRGCAEARPALAKARWS
jgi:hypothetical protein